MSFGYETAYGQTEEIERAVDWALTKARVVSSSGAVDALYECLCRMAKAVRNDPLYMAWVTDDPNPTPAPEKASGSSGNEVRIGLTAHVDTLVVGPGTMVTIEGGRIVVNGKPCGEPDFLNTTRIVGPYSEGV